MSLHEGLTSPSLIPQPGFLAREDVLAIRADVEAIKSAVAELDQKAESLSVAAGGAGAESLSRLDIFHNYSPILVIAFLVTLVATPLMRRLALTHGVIDRPNEARKIHREPVAYLGGVAVFLGVMAGILFSFIAHAFDGVMEFHTVRSPSHLDMDGNLFPVPPSILLGMTAIVLVGLLDDVMGISPRVKLGGQLLAAAALAIDDVGVRVAGGIMKPIGQIFGDPNLVYDIPLGLAVPFLAPTGSIHIDLVYWTGTAVIALFVLGACNASNLIDGLDGLLTGVTGIASFGLLIVALGMAMMDDGPRDSQRIILCLALLGACLGFLPHNFNPATIFLGDAGSLLMGFTTIVIILTLGDNEQTQLVLAGMIIYAIPLIDTTLAIVRRKMAGKSISSADSDHLHHMLKRAFGVKGAVLTLYGLGVVFAGMGIWLSMSRARVVYILALIFASFIGVTAIKIARRKQTESQAAAAANSARPLPVKAPGPSAAPRDDGGATGQTSGSPVQAGTSGAAAEGEVVAPVVEPAKAS
ncbi:MAG: undecaprenyl/decaprenyl-phosphate alpha-N-acetylglucosaminyl 1-phosphate transferase [Phycisphaeraceae bacterium]|nr:undecaprenyl/decaprenyl-phosphate alpha-N-acetylglucosaminyl 1-phosphate transferase [Phycisphaerae bacterium]MBX3393522.1 undecaprenyl/decaprenyl-phosphate alpha-N-acetylglucosaminyl 1-phosphate transferase [Phycisphaeraceae bacterium]